MCCKFQLQLQNRSWNFQLQLQLRSWNWSWSWTFLSWSWSWIELLVLSWSWNWSWSWTFWSWSWIELLELDPTLVFNLHTECDALRHWDLGYLSQYNEPASEEQPRHDEMDLPSKTWGWSQLWSYSLQTRHSRHRASPKNWHAAMAGACGEK